VARFWRIVIRVLRSQIFYLAALSLRSGPMNYGLMYGFERLIDFSERFKRQTVMNCAGPDPEVGL